MEMFKRIKELFKPKLPNGKTYDLTEKKYYLGKIENNGRNLKVMGWGEAPRRGDYLILRYPNSFTETTRYQVESAHYFHGLDIGVLGMWEAETIFAPRAALQPKEDK
jgi:hypothetical protein